MIRMIVADMDGTLLDSRKRLPQDLFPLIRQLRDRNVRFVVASGRQYYNLEAQFGEVADQVTFLSENGALICEKGKPIFVDEMPEAHWKSILEAVDGIPDAFPVLCGVKSAYISSRDPEFLRNVETHYKKYKIVENLQKVKDPVCKIAVYDLGSAEENSWKALAFLKDRFNVSLSGDHWVDVMETRVNKGAALAALEKLYGIAPEETMAFGDYLNDLEMMASCLYSFAMANAHPDVKAAARFEAPSNDENGVVRAIRQQLDLPFHPLCRKIDVTDPDYQAELALRDQVLRRPIGRSIADDDLSEEGTCCHIGAFDGNCLIGCMVLRPGAGAVRMCQVAVRPEYRGRGVGREMEAFAELCAREMGAASITVHARKTALGFYEAVGFEETGGEFLEVGIPHFPMQKDL